MKEQEPQEVKVRTDPYEITQMPTQEVLEEFLRKMSGAARRWDVVFRLDTGVFESKPVVEEPYGT